MQPPLSIGDLLSSGTYYLKEHGSKTPRLDAELLLSFILQKSRAGLILKAQEPANEKLLNRYQKLIRSRGKAMPVAYLTGVKEFMSLSFSVDSSVLIPRPETEILVEHLLSRFRHFQNIIQGVDVGTGCGCIAISLAHYLPKARVCATDISIPALSLAHKNARNLGVAARVKFFLSELFKGFGFQSIAPGSLDFIVSNPPYIPRSQLSTLAADVLCEPHQALDGGRDGLDFYQRLIKGACFYLKEGGVLALEVGAGQAKEITTLFNESGRYRFPVFYPDLSGHTRVVMAEKKGG